MGRGLRKRREVKEENNKGDRQGSVKKKKKKSGTIGAFFMFQDVEKCHFVAPSWQWREMIWGMEETEGLKDGNKKRGRKGS